MSVRAEELSPVKRALLEIRDLRARLQQAEGARLEPIAIVGAGVRVPGGVTTLEQFWTLLIEGRDAITEVPASRWAVDQFYDADPGAPGKIATRFGGFLERIDEFDAKFFGITPREAISLDPQQRLLLEVAWEALEHAGQAPDALTGHATGVFVGLSSTDYMTTAMKFTAAADIDAYLATGGHPSVASGRISYVLGLQGPSFTIDTACSSSLAAVHLAAQSLRLGECAMALAGGVSLMLLPELSINFSRAQMMAPDGRCKTFDSRADGYVRSEGCGVVVLKRLSDAVAAGDRILGLIRGSAVNQDGRSSGLTVPNGPAQESVIREALARAGASAADVDYVEAHGTGTALGDPVELRALGNVFRDGRTPARPLRIGSVKTNVGHMEAAAGVTGLIKVLLSMQHGVIPPHLHLTQPTPHVDWDELALHVPTSATPWPREHGGRLAGVSAFGFSGTNAHVVIGEAPSREPAAEAAGRPLHILALSGKTEAALRQSAARFAAHLDTESLSLADVCYTANVGRAHFSERAAIVAASTREARAALISLAAGEASPAIVTAARLDAKRPEIAFLFAGLGAQQAGMGRQLFETQPTFRRALEKCDAILRPHLEQPLLSVLYPAAGEHSPIDETAYSQPVLFAFEYALAELWRSWGVEPTFVAGHSLGEDVAACVAGVFSLENGLEMIAARAQLMATSLDEGAMSAVFAPEHRVAELIAAEGIAVDIAAINGPHHVIVAGVPADVSRATARFEAEGIKVRRLNVNRPCHSALMEPVLDRIEHLASRMALGDPRLAVASTLTGRMAASGELSNAQYWRRHVRGPVRFCESIRALYDEGARVLVEIGPNGTVTGMGRRCLDAGDAVWVQSLTNDGNDWAQALQALGTLYAHGAAVRWDAFDRDYARRKVSLPTYPFQRQRFWSEAVRPRTAAPPAARWTPLGRRLHSPALTGIVYESEIGLSSWPALADHRVQGAALVPASLFAEMALSGAPGHSVVTDLEIHAPMILDEDQRRMVQVIFASPGDSFSILSAATASGGEAPEWIRHATGLVPPSAGTEGEPAATVDLDSIRAACAEEVDAGAFYASLTARGFDMGARFRAIKRIWRGQNEAIGEVEVPPGAGEGDIEWHLHPVLIDACFHVAAATLDPGDTASYLFAGFSRLVLRRHGVTRVWSHVRMRPGGPDDRSFAIADVMLFDDEGNAVGEITGVTFQRVRGALARPIAEWQNDWLCELAWRAKQLPAASRMSDHPGGGTGLDTTQLADRVRRAVPALAETHAMVQYGDGLNRLESLATGYVIAAFHELGVPCLPGAVLSAAGIVASHGVQSRHRKLLDRLLVLLAEDGYLEAADAGWLVIKPLPVVDPTAVAVEMTAAGLPCDAELVLTVRCGPQLASVLRGAVNPAQLLFPNGSAALVERIYQESPAARFFNNLARQAVSGIVGALPSGRRLRVLEVGAGTGGTTATLLPEFANGQTEYVFTDVSPLFLENASEKFREYDFIDYRLLDLERDPLTQGFAAQAFDVIVAVNVLHATADLSRTLAALRSLLSPGGVILLGEATVPRRWLDITFGVTEGWWRFNDHDLRPAHPLLKGASWLRLLESSGFEDASALPESGAKAPEIQALILARQPVAAAPIAKAGRGRWIILADTSGMAVALAARLSARGFVSVMVRPSGVGPHLAADHRVDLADARAFDAVVEQATRPDDVPLRGCIHLWSLDATPLDAVTAETVEAAWLPAALGHVHLAQSLSRLRSSAPIWMVTSGAVAATTTERPAGATQSPLWGFGRVLGLEHPELMGALIDVDGDAANDADRVLAEVLEGDGEDQIAWRGDRRFVARLARTGRIGAANVPLRADGSYLVTGGLGHLGLEVARWMASRGAGHLVLQSRRGLPERGLWPQTPRDSEDGRRIGAITAIEGLGATVTVATADVANPDQMRGVFAAFGNTIPELRGIVHAAAQAGTARLAELTAEDLRSMLRPKVTGTCLLHELSASRPLDFFVMFSSTTGLLGSVGMGHYAAANVFLDAFAQARRSAACPITSIAWGAWSPVEVGSSEMQRALEGGGLKLMPVDAALEAFGRLLRPATANAIVVDADWPALVAAYESRRHRPLLAEMVRPVTGPRSKSNAAAAARGTALPEIEAAPLSERRDIVTNHVLREAARVLRVAPDELEPAQGLFDLGIDSLMSVELKGRLEIIFDRKLPATLTFNYPSVSAIATFIAAELGIETARGPVQHFEPDNRAAAAPQVVAAGPDLDNLSESELAALLTGRLADL